MNRQRWMLVALGDGYTAVVAESTAEMERVALAMHGDTGTEAGVALLRLIREVDTDEEWTHEIWTGPWKDEKDTRAHLFVRYEDGTFHIYRITGDTW